MGILYFIQPAELVGTNRFKVGCSTKNDLSRVKSYKAGTRMIMILQCEDPFLLEQKVLVEFKNQFHKIAGNEYFEGDESVMRKAFYDTYLQWEHQKDGIAKWRNDKLKEQQQRLAQLQKDLEVLRLEIVQGEAYLERVMRGEEDETILAQHTTLPVACSPITKVYEDIQSVNVPPMAHFLEKLIVQYADKTPEDKVLFQKHGACDMYTYFTDWLAENGYKKLEYNSTKFGRELKEYEGIEKKRRSDGVIYHMNFEVLKTYLVKRKWIEDLPEDSKKY